MSVVDTAVERRRGWLIPTRHLIWTLYVYAAWYAVCVALILGLAAGIRGQLYLPAQGDGYVDPRDLWPGTPHLVGTLVFLTAMVGHFVAASLVAVAISRLAKPQIRANRRVSLLLLGGAILAAATVVLTLSAPGETLRGWLLD